MAKQLVRKIVSLVVSYTKDVKANEPTSWNVGKDGVVNIQEANDYFVIWHETNTAEVVNRGCISRFKFKVQESEIEVPDEAPQTAPVQIQA
jgi:hypothetical protein